MFNPFSLIPSFQLRIALLLLIVAALAGLTTYFHHKVYTAGYDDGTMQGRIMVADAQNQGLQEYVKLQTILTKTEAVTRDMELQIEHRLQNVNATGRTQVVTVEKIIHDNPAFASIARPADLDQLRTTQLAAIATDTAAGQAAAAKLPRASLRTMRIPDSDFGQYAGGNRDSRHDQPDTLAGLRGPAQRMVELRL